MRESTDPLANQPSVHIRPAGLQDRSFLRELAQKVFSVYGSYDRYLTEWSDSDETITLIGEIGDERVGLAIWTNTASVRHRGSISSSRRYASSFWGRQKSYPVIWINLLR